MDWNLMTAFVYMYGYYQTYYSTRISWEKYFSFWLPKLKKKKLIILARKTFRTHLFSTNVIFFPHKNMLPSVSDNDVLGEVFVFLYCCISFTTIGSSYRLPKYAIKMILLQQWWSCYLANEVIMVQPTLLLWNNKSLKEHFLKIL